MSIFGPSLKATDTKAFLFKAMAEDCQKRGAYDELRELMAQWSTTCAWADRSFEEQEVLLWIACEVLK